MCATLFHENSFSMKGEIVREHNPVVSWISNALKLSFYRNHCVLVLHTIAYSCFIVIVAGEIPNDFDKFIVSQGLQLININGTCSTCAGIIVRISPDALLTSSTIVGGKIMSRVESIKFVRHFPENFSKRSENLLNAIHLSLSRFIWADLYPCNASSGMFTPDETVSRLNMWAEKASKSTQNDVANHRGASIPRLCD